MAQSDLPTAVRQLIAMGGLCAFIAVGLAVLIGAFLAVAAVTGK